MHSNNVRPRLFSYALLAMSMALVGSYVALSKPLVLVLPVFLLAWLRFGIGGLATLHWLKRPASEPAMTPHTRALVFLESLLGNFLFSICMLFGVSMTSAVSAGVVMASGAHHHPGIEVERIFMPDAEPRPFPLYLDVRLPPLFLRNPPIPGRTKPRC